MENSHLSRLPAELRNQIWTTVLVLDHRFKCALDKDGVIFPKNKSEECAAFLALATVCRQIQDETLSMFYGANVFRLLTWGSELRNATNTMGNWIEKLGGTARRLRTVEIELEFTPTELLHNMPRIAKIFAFEKLNVCIYVNAIWTESGFDRSTLLVLLVLRCGRLDVEGYRNSVAIAASVQREMLRTTRKEISFAEAKQELRDLKDARKELLSLPGILGLDSGHSTACSPLASHVLPSSSGCAATGEEACGVMQGPDDDRDNGFEDSKGPEESLLRTA